MFKKLLVAFDGSNHSQKALRQAMQMAEDNGAALHILHVFQLPALIVGESFISAPPQLEADTYRKAEQVLEQAQTLAASLPNVTGLLKYGRPAEVTLEYAEAIQADLIIVGSRGLSGIRELVLGSVSHNIVQHAKVPVLVVK
ncbi:universal stress protein [Gorillibacterium sp. sgz5001074]|uniref:universal stress protein n=1 Tax=Gorillibacterium sp. sgz5001074 TaxID=3446695 RepID=UPI003F67342C